MSKLSILTFNAIAQQGLDIFSEHSISASESNPDGILLRSHKLTIEQLSQFKNLKAIARAGTGIDNIPSEWCKEQGIEVFNAAGANANAVAELVMGCMLHVSRNLSPALEFISSLTVTKAFDQVENKKKLFKGFELSGNTLALVGCGAIGKLLAKKARAFDMRVLGYDPFLTENELNELGITKVSDFQKLLDTANFVSLHLPATAETKHLVDDDFIAKMPDDAVLLNFARESVVNNDAVIRALNNNKLARYVSDFPNEVFSHFDHNKILCLPHLGASTAQAESNASKIAAERLLHYLGK